MPGDGIGLQMRAANEFLDLQRPVAIVVPTWIPMAAAGLAAVAYALGRLTGVM